MRRLTAALLTCVLLAGCGPSVAGSRHPMHSSPPPPTATAVPELTAHDFYSIAWWVDGNPHGCHAYLESYGALIHQNARYHPRDQMVHYGLAYLATLQKYCHRDDWTNVKAAADVMKAWAQANGG